MRPYMSAVARYDWLERTRPRPASWQLPSAVVGLLVETEVDAELLVVGGQNIDEPVVAYGPFVMNTPQEIQAAIDDVRAGRFGELD